MLTTMFPPLPICQTSLYIQAETCLLTLSPDTVGRSVSGELAVILCVAITPGKGHKEVMSEVRYEDAD